LGLITEVSEDTDGGDRKYDSKFDFD